MEMKKIDYINNKIYKKDVTNPQYLYKYRPFDEFTIDMLENEYVYLCPAENLDDPSECKVDISIHDLYEWESGQIKFSCVELILNIFKPLIPAENFEMVKNLVYDSIMPNGKVKRNFLIDDSAKIQKLVPETNIAPLINFLGIIPEKLDDSNIKDCLEELLVLALSARKSMGICSLSELKNSKKMWQNYADKEKGYCIEYDFQEYENLDFLYPVMYQDNRETNLVINLIATFIGHMIDGMNYKEIVVDKSQVMRMFLTKDTKWKYQKEWRFLGDANKKLSAPRIHAIYIGKNMSKLNQKKIIDYCQKHNITVHMKDKKNIKQI